MKQVTIPQYVDDPPHVLFWQADEVAPIGLGLVLGVFFGMAGILTLAGDLMTRVYRKYRDRNPDGYLAHMIWWYTGIGGPKARSIPNPFINRLH